ncbi:MAG: XdhC family protein [Gemmatimonadota bacterium]
MSVNEVLDFVRRGSQRGEPTGVALLVEAWRSAPRAPGARYSVGPGGTTAGSISAGCVEADLGEHLAAITSGAPARLVRYGIDDAEAAAVGLSCGGAIEVLVQRHEPGDPVWAWLSDAADHGPEAVLVTDLSDPIPGRQLLVAATGERIGTLGDEELDGRAFERAQKALTARSRPTIEVPAPGDRLFVEPVLRPPRLFAVGATATAIALADLGRVAGFSITIVDPRETLALRAMEAGATTVRSEPGAAFRDARLGPGDAVAVLAHDSRLDGKALRAALEGGAGYVGLLGGRRTQKARRTALLEEGIDPAWVEKIRGPVGLDIGADSPHEIAISILAELIRHWNLPDVPGG